MNNETSTIFGWVFVLTESFYLSDLPAEGRNVGKT